MRPLVSDQIVTGGGMVLRIRCVTSMETTPRVVESHTRPSVVSTAEGVKLSPRLLAQSLPNKPQPHKEAKNANIQ